jgi:transposase
VKKSGRKSIMVWAVIARDGVGRIHICNESVNAAYYQRILREEVPLSKLMLQVGDCYWVQDNASAHWARSTQAMLGELGLENVHHPPCSPDLNPIEHMWAIMKRKLNENPCTSLADLETRIKDIWYDMDEAVVRTVVESMPTRLEEVLKANGGYTRYW